MNGSVERARSALRTLAEDLGAAGQHLLLVAVGGSPYLPRAGRKWVYRLAGAQVESAPGMGFMFNGDPANLQVGTNVYFNQRVFVDAMGPVVIGSDTGLGMESLILTSHHEYAGGWSPTVVGRGVRIGNRVGLGARTIVLPGTVIEDDVAVAAGSVVGGRLRAGGLYAGRPARRIKDLVQPSADQAPAG